ncbi:MAG: NAD(P)-dependent oxidoreductase, partial [Stenotrophomonas maltophilia]
MAFPKVFVTRQILDPALELIAQSAQVEVWPEELPPPPEVLREKSAQVDGLLTNVMDRIDGPLLNVARGLKVISQLSVGLDNVDLPEATRRGVPIGYTPGVLAKSTADLAFALLMAAARRIGESERWVRRGNWQLAHHPMHWLGVDIHEATLGIIGMGQIGQEVAQRARGFDMRVLYYSRTRKPELESRHSMEYAELPDLLGA